MKTIVLALCTALGCLLPFTARAQYVTNPHFYGPGPCHHAICDPWSLFLGVVHTGLFNDRHIVTEGGTELFNTNKSNKMGWEIFLGYKFSHHFGLELGYANLGQRRGSEVIFIEGDTLAPGGHYRTYVIPLRSNLSITFCDLTFSALFGIHYYSLHGTLSNTAHTVRLSRFKSGMDLNVGAVIEYRLIEPLGVRLDLTRYYIKHFDSAESAYTDAVTGSVVTYF